MNARNDGRSGRSLQGPVWAAGALVLCSAAAFLFGLRGSGEGGAAAGLREALVPLARADVGRGEYLFLPCRKEMWVVNRVNGKFVHYDLKDVDSGGQVKTSRIAQIDLATFPPRDTDFLLSDRNLNSLLWVGNRVTGDFQMWRVSPDRSLITDEKVANAGDDLRKEPEGPGAEPRPSSERRSGYRPPPGRTPEPGASRKKAEAPKQPSKGE